MQMNSRKSLNRLKCACVLFVQLAYCVVQFLEKDVTLAEYVSIRLSLSISSHLT